MPSGYTYKLYEGEPQSFEEFTIQCARAMGALVLMRDEPISAEVTIDKVQEDYAWHLEELNEATSSLGEVLTMTDEEAEEKAQSKYEKEIEEYESSNQNYRDIRTRYEGMLAQVVDWVPPTEDHEGLKEYMTSQLRDSIKFDTGVLDNSSFRSEPIRLSATEYKDQLVQDALRGIEYHTSKISDAFARNKERVEWTKALLDNLASRKQVEANLAD